MKLAYFFLIATVAALLDQITKYLALDLINSAQPIEVIPGLFNFVLVFNSGVAFGMLAGLDDHIRTLIIAVTTFAALVILFCLYFRAYRYDKWASLAVALILGGAVGNIIDRIRIGDVVDFLDFYYDKWHWPAFNLADSFICVGVAILLFVGEGKKGLDAN